MANPNSEPNGGQLGVEESSNGGHRDREDSVKGQEDKRETQDEHSSKNEPAIAGDSEQLEDTNIDDELTPNLSEELARVENGSMGSLSGGDMSDDDQLQGDTWIEELECALLADCDPTTLKKISEGRRIPSALRPDYWRALLAINDSFKVKLTGEYDLPNQIEIRTNCERLVEDISKNLAQNPLSEADKLRLRSDFESTLTTYVKARPELTYVPGNGWTDILRVLYHLELSDIQLYQMFLRIVDRYIPKDLSPRSQSPQLPEAKTIPSDKTNNSEDAGAKVKLESQAQIQQQHQIAKRATICQLDMKTRSIQAYHLLRLLIQYHDPELCSILDSSKVTTDLYVKDWFCSLFARSCSTQLALLIWDTHFKMADPFLIFFAAIVMVVNASEELKQANMSQPEMLKVLKSMPSKLEEDDIEDLYYLVSNHYTNSTPRSIRCYSHLFFMDTFGNTYLGNESPEDGQPLLDLKTTQLTSSLDLSQYLCLPIVPAEIFALDTAHLRSSPTHSASSLRYFLVDCRPAEQYNAGHMNRAFHLDCSLMLREPSSFATAVQALLEIQRQVVASKSNTGGQHLCFIGSGQEEEDQYVNMVVASFLQKYQRYVSIVVGGFDAIHDYVSNKSELRDLFNKYIVDHNSELCKTCYSRSPEGIERFKAARNMANSTSGATGTSGGINFSSTQSLFSSTTSFLRGDKGSSATLSASTFTKLASNAQASATANLIAQSGASMFDKFTTALMSRSSVIKDRLVETLNTTTLPSPTLQGASTGSNERGHVSSQDKLGRRYTGGNLKYAIDENDDQGDLFGRLRKRADRSPGGQQQQSNEGSASQEIQIDVWQRQAKILAFYKCAQIKGTNRYPGYVGLSRTHLWILREIAHNKGFASVAAKRPLDMVVQITSKRRQPDLIIFRYGYANSSSPKTSAESTSPSSSLSSGQKDGAQESPATSEGPKAAKSLPSIIASDHLHIPQAFELVRLVKREIVRIMDENSRALRAPQSRPSTTATPPPQLVAAVATTTVANEPTEQQDRLADSKSSETAEGSEEAGNECEE